MDNQKFEGQLRHLLSAIASILVFRGYMEVGEVDSFYHNVEMAVGSIIYFATSIRSWITKKSLSTWKNEIAREVILLLEGNSKLDNRT